MLRATVRCLCLGKSLRGENIFSLNHGIKSHIGTDAMFANAPPETHRDADEPVDSRRRSMAVLGKAAELLAPANQYKRPDPQEFTYVPTLKRSWVKAPPSVLSTRATRQDWFRFMSYNMMADSFHPHPRTGTTGGAAETRTTPVVEVDVRIPGFSRSGEGEDAGCDFVTYDRSIDKNVPPFLDFTFRRSYLVNEVRYYDPDLLCLNEVNRSHFNGDLWKYLRFQGYGAMYTSSRGHRVKALRKGDLSTHEKNKSKISEAEDVGNAIFFHKGRFVPFLMPGAELPNHLSYAQFCSLKDKITNLDVLVANVQLTVGETEEAKAIRAQEASMVVKVLKAITAQSVDRSHGTVIVCGDLNNCDDEEECVLVLRQLFFSAYDLVGGPRWTTWFRAKDGVIKPNKYYEANKRGWEEAHTAKHQLDAQLLAMKRREEDREMARLIHAKRPAHDANVAAASSGSDAAAVLCSSPQPSSSSALSQSIIKNFEASAADALYPWLRSEAEGQQRDFDETAANSSSTDGAARRDELAVQKELMLSQGIIKRTQDFIFYDPTTLALHQVLDTPDDTEIHPTQLLPCTKHPSHHLHLVIDVSFNNPYPDVGEISKRPN